MKQFIGYDRAIKEIKGFIWRLMLSTFMTAMNVFALAFSIRSGEPWYTSALFGLCIIVFYGRVCTLQVYHHGYHKIRPNPGR